MGWVLKAVVVAGVLLVAGCAPISAIEGHYRADPEAVKEQVFVASIRASRFKQQRETHEAAPFSYSAYTVAVPPTHTVGTLPKHTGSSGLDPRANFLGVGRLDYRGASGFEAAVAAAPAGPAMIFAHGFNTSFEESITGQAQMAHDLNLQGPQVVFAWPSDSTILTYKADKARAIAAGEELAAVVSRVAAARRGPIILAGYSMGANTVLTALAELRGAPSILARTEVVLFAPDVPRDEFAALAETLPPLAKPVVVFGNRHDRALRLARMAFHVDGLQLGNARNAAQLPDTAMIFVEVGSVAHRGNGHFPVVTYPPLIALFTAAAEQSFADFAIALQGLSGAQVSHNGRATYVQLPRF